MSDNNSVEKAPKKKRNISPEGRERLRQAALKRHAEGKLGGSKYGKMGGRPKKDRAAKAVAEAAQDDENRKAIIKVFKDAVDEHQPMGTRLKGAELWLNVEREEGKLALQEEVANANEKSRDELIAILAEKLMTGPTARIIESQIEREIIADAVVVEEGDDDGNAAAA